MIFRIKFRKWRILEAKLSASPTTQDTARLETNANSNTSKESAVKLKEAEEKRPFGRFLLALAVFVQFCANLDLCI